MPALPSSPKKRPVSFAASKIPLRAGAPRYRNLEDRQNGQRSGRANSMEAMGELAQLVAPLTNEIRSHLRLQADQEVTLVEAEARRYQKKMARSWCHSLSQAVKLFAEVGRDIPFDSKLSLPRGADDCGQIAKAKELLLACWDGVAVELDIDVRVMSSLREIFNRRLAKHVQRAQVLELPWGLRLSSEQVTGGIRVSCL